MNIDIVLCILFFILGYCVSSYFSDTALQKEAEFLRQQKRNEWKDQLDKKGEELLVRYAEAKVRYAEQLTKPSYPPVKKEWVCNNCSYRNLT